MNTRIAWKDVAEIIAISAIVASLIFVGLQMQQTQSIALSGVMAANIGHRIETNNAIANNAVVWTKANSGAELEEAEAVLVDRLMDNLSVERASLWLHYQGLGREQSAERILADYAGFLYRNPGIYQRWVDKEKKLIADRSVLLGAEFSLDAWVKDMRTRVEKLKKAQQGN
jgi:hypothetical protein